MNQHRADNFYYLIGCIVIYMGVRFALRGKYAGSKPRIVAGTAIVGIGISQFFRAVPLAGIIIIVVSFLAFIVSLFMLRNEIMRSQ